MKRIWYWFSVFTLLISSVISAPGFAFANWPQFRGPHGAGLANDPKPGPTEIGPGKNEIWKTPMPSGVSSPCIWGHRIFLTGCEAENKRFETLCINSNDGRVIWRKTLTVDHLEPVHKTSNPASATPACDGERVYIYFASYGLIAYTLDGDVAWEFPLPIPNVMFGSGTSPIVAGDLIILNRLLTASFFGQPAGNKEKRGGEKATSEILAVDRRTGKVAWRERIVLAPPFGRSYMTPTTWSIHDNHQVIVAGGGRITALNGATGKPIWWSDGLPSSATASPIIADGRLFLNCTGAVGDVDRVPPPTFEQTLEKCDSNKDGKLQRKEVPDDLIVFTRHRADGEGDFSVKTFYFQRADTDRDGALSKQEWDRLFKESADATLEMMKPATVSLKLGGEGNVTAANTVWKTHKGVPEVPSLLIVGKRLYAVRNGGLVICSDAETGKVHFEERLGSSGSYYASPISDGTHVYFISQPGVVTILRASNRFERLGRFDLEDEVSATPALVDGRLYIRTGKHLYGFGAK